MLGDWPPARCATDGGGEAPAGKARHLADIFAIAPQRLWRNRRALNQKKKESNVVISYKHIFTPPSDDGVNFSFFNLLLINDMAKSHIHVVGGAVELSLPRREGKRSQGDDDTQT